MQRLSQAIAATKRNFIQICFLSCAAIILSSSIIYQSFQNTIHTVIPALIYRSAQLSPRALEQLITKQHVRSVINLRGPNPGKTWYQKELQITQELGAQHYDVTLSSYLLPRVDQLQKLIQLIESATPPILIHCESGIDRTGLASALALILEKNAALEKAERQFSLFYMDTSYTSVAKKVFPYYTAWLERNNLESSQAALHQWIYSPAPFSKQDNRSLKEL